MSEKIRELPTDGDPFGNNDIDGPIARAIDNEIVPVTIKLHDDMINALHNIAELEKYSSRSELIRQMLAIAINQYSMRKTTDNRQCAFNPLTGEQYDVGSNPKKGDLIRPAPGNIADSIKDIAQAEIVQNPLDKYTKLKYQTVED